MRIECEHCRKRELGGSKAQSTNVMQWQHGEAEGFGE
jgi:hypothetical protein